MENYLVYIGKSAVAAGAFYLVFLLLFKNKKQFLFNRIYLSASMASSFIIPLITFTTIKYVEPVQTVSFNSVAFLPNVTETTTTQQFVFEWYQYLFGLYILMGAGFLLNLILGHLKALHIINNSETKTLFKTKVNVTKRDVHPFSFFNKIVVSERNLLSHNLEVIVSHEKIHVEERHTLDILFAEILFLVQWFNPFAWLLKDAIKNNLEYKTDNRIIQKFDAENYQLAMVALADRTGVAPFLTALNGSQLKNRIIMMKKKTENKYAFLKQLIVLPLLAILVMGLSNKEVKTEVVQKKNTKSEVAQNTDWKVEFRNTNHAINKKKYDDNAPEHVTVATIKSVDKSKTFTATKLPDQRNRPGLKNNSCKDSVYVDPDKLPQFPGGELELKKFISKNVKYPILAQESGTKGKVFVTFIISEKGKVTNPHISRSVDPLLDKEALRVVNMLPNWEPGEKDGKNIAVPYTVPITFNLLEITSTVVNTEPLYIVDGKEVENVDEIDPDNIESISVLKNKNSISLYGEKGKNGAVLITTRKHKTFDTSDKIVIVDGKEYKGDINDIAPEDIVSIEVKKEDKTKVLFGEQPKKDKIIIQTKTKYNTTTITNKLELRKFIAQAVKYPKAAADKALEGEVTVYIEINRKNKMAKVVKKRAADFLMLDDVVVTSTIPENKEKTTDNKSELFKEEVKRVIETVPAIDINEFNGKTVGITVRFALRSY